MSDAHEPAPVPLEVATDLDLEIGGVPVAVSSTGDRVFLDFPSVRSAISAGRRRPAMDYGSVDALLRTGDLAVEVRVHHRTVLALGAATRPSLLLQRAGLHPVELRLTGVLSAVGAGVAAVLGRLRRAFD